MEPFVMTQEGVKNASQEKRVELLQTQVESTTDQLSEALGTNSHKFFKRLFTRQERSLLRSQYLEQAPETFINQNLVWPLLSILGYEYKIEASMHSKNSDFLITNTPSRIIGEIKTFGHYSSADEEVFEYAKLSNYEYGLITDGLYWKLVEVDKEKKSTPLIKLQAGDLRGAVSKYVAEEGYVDEDVAERVSRISTTHVSDFYTQFNRNSISNSLDQRP